MHLPGCSEKFAKNESLTGFYARHIMCIDHKLRAQDVLVLCERVYLVLAHDQLMGAIVI